MLDASFDADVVSNVIDDFYQSEDDDLTKISFIIKLAKTIVDISLHNMVDIILN